MFSERLRLLRRQRGITQVQFAQELNVANGTIAMWETGKREPDFATIIRLSKFFNVTVDYLLGNEHGLIQDECSKLFRHNLSIKLDSIEISDFSGAPEAEYDYRKLQELSESTYPLSLKEADEAADIIGVSLHDLFRKDFEEFMKKKGPIPVSEDELNDTEKILMQYVKDLTEDQKKMLLAQMQVMKESQRESLHSSVQG